MECDAAVESWPAEVCSPAFEARGRTGCRFGVIQSDYEYRRQYLHFAPNTRRCTGCFFSLHAMDYFLEKNDLVSSNLIAGVPISQCQQLCVIRAHMLLPDMKAHGFKLHWSCGDDTGTRSKSGPGELSARGLWQSALYFHVAPVF